MKISQRLSWITVGWGAYIIVSAAFMLQVNVWLTAAVGDPFLAGCFRTTSVLILIAALAYAFKTRLDALRVCAVLLIFALCYFLGTWQEYFAEKTHILSYGLLGYLVSNDLIAAGKKPAFKNIAMAISFIALVSALDETFQKILPYRVGDIKDFMTNVISGALGMCLFIALKVGKKLR